MNSWPIINPRTGAQIKDYSFSSEKDVFDSLQKLNQGFKKWRQKTFRERQQKIMDVISLVEKDQARLAQSITDEMGKSAAQSQAEVKKCIESVKYLCQLDSHYLEVRTIKNNTYDQSEVIFEPVGIVLSILPWNYPAWQGFRAFIPALLAGNTILLKHSEVSPTTGDLIQSYFDQAGHGDLLQHHIFRHELTEKIIADSRLGGSSITGSVKAGKIISSLCSTYFKKCVLELGGSDPALVLENADLEKTCQSVAKSRLQNSGQVCISAKRMIIPSSKKEIIFENLKKTFQDILNDKVELVGPLAHSRFKADYNNIVSELKTKSVLIFEQDLSSKNTNDNMAYVNPCILYFEKNHEILKTTEVFGPCLVVIPYEKVEEGIEIANSTIFGLGASVYGADINQCRQIASELQAGQVAINDFVRSDVCLPFGGYKMSGQGREIGIQGFFEFTQVKVISLKK